MPRNVADDINDLAFVNAHFVRMMFYPAAWDEASDSSRTWTISDFPPVPRNSIPPEPGVYVFVVQPQLFDFISSSGLFYVGKATNLYTRIGGYLGEQNKKFIKSKRPHIWRMVNQWKGHLKYYFTTTATVAEAEELEDEMLSAFRPPFNKQYSAEVSQIMRAF